MRLVLLLVVLVLLLLVLLVLLLVLLVVLVLVMVMVMVVSYIYFTACCVRAGPCLQLHRQDLRAEADVRVQWSHQVRSSDCPCHC